MKHGWLSVGCCRRERNRKKGIIYFTGRLWLTTQVKGWTTTDFSPSLHPHFIPFHPTSTTRLIFNIQNSKFIFLIPISVPLKLHWFLIAKLLYIMPVYVHMSVRNNERWLFKDLIKSLNTKNKTLNKLLNKLHWFKNFYPYIKSNMMSICLYVRYAEPIWFSFTMYLLKGPGKAHY